MAIHSSIFSGESHGQRILAGYSPWGRKESDTTERLSVSTSTPKIFFSLSSHSLSSTDTLST